MPSRLSPELGLDQHNRLDQVRLRDGSITAPALAAKRQNFLYRLAHALVSKVYLEAHYSV
jgi:hypothetical protein